MSKRDEFHERVISLIKADPTLNRRQMAARLGLEYANFVKKFTELTDKKIIQEGFLINPEYPGSDLKKFWILIETRFPFELQKPDADGPLASDYQAGLIKKIKEKLEGNNDFSQHISLCEIEIMLGADWDIILSVYARDMDKIAFFVTQFLRTQSEIARTRTAWSRALSESN